MPSGVSHGSAEAAGLATGAAANSIPAKVGILLMAPIYHEQPTGSPLTTWRRPTQRYAGLSWLASWRRPVRRGVVIGMLERNDPALLSRRIQLLGRLCGQRRQGIDPR